jgi:tetratricopeptide (TPR) repeat protein
LPHLSKREESALLSDRALARNLNGRPRDALIDYTKAIETHSLPAADQITALLERGLVLEMLNRLNSALDDYSAVLKLVPNYATALNRRANTYRRLNQLKYAQRDYFAALAANNASREHPYYGLGQIAEAQGDPGAARKYYENALAANPDFAMATEALGNLNAISGAPMASGLPGGTAGATSQTRTLRPSRPPANSPVPLGSPRLKPKTTIETDRKSVTPRLRPTLAPRRESAISRAVQLGAWRTEDEAAAGWVNTVKLAGKLLLGVAPSIIPAEIPHKGRYFRLRINITGSVGKLCEALKAKGVDCIPVRD